MGIFNEIVEDIKNILSADSNLSTVNFINAYRKTIYPNPIKNIYAAIGISAIDSSAGAFGNYAGEKEDNGLYGKNCFVTVNIRIYSPKEEGGLLCSETFSKIFDCLFLNEGLKQLDKISCKEVTFDKNSDAYSLDCHLKMKVFIGNVSEEIEISNIEVEGEI